MANAKYTIGIEYQVDKQSVKAAKESFDEIIRGRTTAQQKEDLFGLNKTKEDITRAKDAALELEGVLSKNINPDLGRMSIKGLNEDLKQIGSQGLAELNISLSGIGVKGTNAFNSMAASALSMNQEIHKAKGLMDKMADVMTRTIQWSVASSAMKRFTSEVSGAYSYVKNLDTSLNNIRIVTGKSSDEMSEFAENANKAAAALGRSTRDYTDASLIFYQQGLDDEEAQRRADITLKTANITKQATSTVSEQLTAVWNGYKVSIEESELYIDRLAAVAANSASSLGELATGMSKVASAAAAMGVTEEQLASQISTIISVTRQAPESVGTALKTIYARMSDIKMGTEESGVTLGNYTQKMADMGVAVLDSAGEMRDLGVVIEEIGEKWSTYSREQQIALAQTMAGTRQYNNLIALFDGWEQYTNMLGIASDAEGTLAEQNEVYMQSVEAHLQVMETRWEGFKDSLLDTDTINFFVDLFGKIGEFAEKLVDSLGGGVQAIGAIVAAVSPILNSTISKNLSTIMINVANNKAYMQNLKNQKETADIYSNAYRSDIKNSDSEKSLKLAKELGEFKAKTLTYDKLLTEEEKKQVDLLIKQRVEAENNKNIWEQQDALSKDYAKVVSNISNNTNIVSGLDTLYGTDSTIDERLGAIDEIKEAFQELNGLIDEQNEKIQTNVSQYNDSAEAVKKLREEINAQFKKKYTTSNPNLIFRSLEKIDAAKAGFSSEQVQALEEYKNKLTELKNQVKLVKEDFKNFGQNIDKFNKSGIEGSEDLAKKYQDLTKLLGGNKINWNKILYDPADTSQKQRLALEEFLNDYNNFLNNVKKGSDEAEKHFEQVANGVGDKITNVLSTIKKKIDNFNKNLKIKINAESITQSLQATTQAINMVRQFQNLITNFDSDNLLNSLSSIVSIGTSALFTYQSLTVVLKGLGNAAGPIAIAITAIVTVIGILNGVIQKAKKNQEELAKAARESAEEQAKSARNAVAEKQEELNKINELYNNYQSLKKQYENQEISMSNLKASAYELCQQYGDMNIALNALAGNFDKVTEAMIKQRLEENQAALDAAKKAREEDLNVANRAEKIGFSSEILRYSSKMAQEDIFIENVSKILGFTPAENFAGIDQTVSIDAETLFQNWDQLQSLVKSAAGTIGNSAEYKSIIAILDKNRDAYQDWLAQNKQINKLIEENYKIQLQSGKLNGQIFNVNDLAGLTALRQQLSESLKNNEDYQGDKSQEAIDKIVDSIIASSLPELYGENARVIFEEAIFNRINEGKGDLQVFSEYISKFSNGVVKQLFNSGLTFSSEEELEKFLDEWSDTLDKVEDRANQIEIFIKPILDLDSKEFKELIAPEEENFFEIMKISSEDFYSSSLAQQKALFAQYRILAKERDEEDSKRNQERYENELETAKKALRALYTERDNYQKQMAGYAAASPEERMFKLASIGDRNESQIDAIKKTKYTRYNESTGSYEEISNTDEDLVDAILAKAAAGDHAISSLQAIQDILEDSENPEEIISNLKKKYEESDDEKEKRIYTYLGFLNGEGIFAQTKASYDEVMAQINSYESKIKKLNVLINESGEIQVDYAEALEIVNQGFEDANKNLSSLDSAYKTLTSAIDEFNNNGSLSISTVESLINLDPKELNLLQYENNELYISEQRLNDLFNSYIDMAEQRAVDRAQTQLQTLAEEGLNDALYEYALGITTATELTRNGAKAAADAAEDFTKLWNKILPDDDKLVAYSEQVNNIQEQLRRELALYESMREHGLDTFDIGAGSKSNRMDDLVDESNLYHDINLILKEIEDSLKRIDRAKKKAYGADYISVLEKEQNLIAKQNEGLKEKLRITQMDRDDTMARLRNYGVNFNADGSYDYFGTLQARYNAAEAAIQAYNANPSDENKDAAEKAKKDYEEFKTLLDKYDKLTSEDIPGLEDQIQENIDKMYEANMEKFDLSIQLRLDTTKALQDFEAFRVQYIEGKDMNLGSTLGEIATAQLTALANNGQLELNTSQLQTALAEAQKIQDGGLSDIYGDNLNEAVGDVKRLTEQVMGDIEQVTKLVDEAQKDFLKSLDDGQAKIDKQLKAWQNINNQIDNSIKLVSLLYGEDEYGTQENYHQQKLFADNQQVDLARQETDYWYSELQKYEEGSEEYEKAFEKYTNATNTLHNATMTAIQDAQAARTAAVKNAFSDLNKEFSQAEESYNLMKKRSELYYNSVNSTYQLSALERKINEAMSGNNSIAAQKKLNDLKAKTVDIMQDQEELSKYEVERANKLYDITLKQIELEEARNNKTSMRLQRDSQGNYSYQYVADMDAIVDAEAAIADAYNDLYNFDLGHYEEIQLEIFNIAKEYTEKVEAVYADASLSEKEREEELLRLKQEYEPYITSLYTEESIARMNTAQSAAASVAASYGDEASAFDIAVRNMETSYNEIVVGKIFNGFTEIIGDLIDDINGDKESSFSNQFDAAITSCEKACERYQAAINEIERTSGLSFTNIKTGIDDISKSLAKLVTQSNTSVMGAIQNEIDKAKLFRDTAKEVKTSLEQWYTQAGKLITQSTKFTVAIDNEQSQAALLSQGFQGVADAINAAAEKLSLSVSSIATGTPGGKYDNLVSNTSYQVLKSDGQVQGRYTTGDQMIAALLDSRMGEKIKIQPLSSKGMPIGTIDIAVTSRENIIEALLKKFSKFDTGGYTGEWGGSGKLAMLHEKELVLNKEDTANFLAAVDKLRELQNISSILESQRNSSLMAMLANLNGNIGNFSNMSNSSNSNLNQTITINADFPGVNTHTEIEMAFNNLVNQATQRAAEYRR